jgi:hypothetical protein
VLWEIITLACPAQGHFAKQNACLRGQYSLRVHILVCMFGLGVMMIENDDDQKGMYLLIYLLQD